MVLRVPNPPLHQILCFTVMHIVCGLGNNRLAPAIETRRNHRYYKELAKLRS